jgi:hypothetical protein
LQHLQKFLQYIIAEIHPLQKVIILISSLALTCLSGRFDLSIEISFSYNNCSWV